MTTTERELWQAHKTASTVQTRNALIEHYLFVAKYAAIAICKQYNRTGNHSFEVDELLTFGVLGLIKAIERYDQKNNAKFETYAVFRVRGAIRDEIRKNNWVPRSARTERERSEGKIVAMVNLTKLEIFDKQEYQGSSEAELQMHTDDFFEAITKSLTKRDAEIVRRYWICGQITEEIAAACGLTRSGVCVAIKRIVSHLRERFQGTEFQHT